MKVKNYEFDIQRTVQQIAIFKNAISCVSSGVDFVGYLYFNLVIRLTSKLCKNYPKISQGAFFCRLTIRKSAEVTTVEQ